MCKSESTSKWLRMYESKSSEESAIQAKWLRWTVWACVNGCLSLYISSLVDRWWVLGVLHLGTVTSGHGVQPAQNTTSFHTSVRPSMVLKGQFIMHIQKLHQLSWKLIRIQLHETTDPKSSSLTCYTATTCWIKLTTSIKVRALKTFLYLFLPTLCPPTVELSDLPPCFTKPVTEGGSQPSASQLQQRIENRNTFLTVRHILTCTVHVDSLYITPVIRL